MAEEQVLEKAPEEEVQPAPKPAENPRNAILASIAKVAFAQHDAEARDNETVPVQHEDGTITEPPAAAPSSAEASPPPEGAEPPASSQAEPAAEAAGEQPPSTAEPAPAEDKEAIDPEKEYEVVVEGQKVKVKGSLIIDAGFRTFQKETAADFRLRTASRLMEEAERRMAAAGQPPAQEQPPAEQPATGTKTEAELATMLQFGTAEQSQEAVRILLSRGTEPAKIVQLAGDTARAAVRDELEFARGKAYLRQEFGDVLAKEPLRHLFFSEEGRLRDGGDKRSYIELYKDIGERIRKDFNLPRPAPKDATTAQSGTREARVAAKKAAPSVPRTAAARLAEQPAAKVKTPSDIIADMQAKRGQHRLISTRKE